jgi:hypothetical protein
VEDHSDDVLLFVGCCVCACSLARGGERREILGRWSLGLQLKNLNEGFNTKKPRDLSFCRWFAGCLIFFILTYEGIVMTVSTLNFLLKMVTEKRVYDYDASM